MRGSNHGSNWARPKGLVAVYCTPCRYSTNRVPKEETGLGPCPKCGQPLTRQSYSDGLRAAKANADFERYGE